MDNAMNAAATFRAQLAAASPLLALAPMQDVTTLAFWRVMMRYGGPDIYWTEYFRVHGSSRLEKWILASITENPTGRPVVAQLIGNEPGDLARAARELQQYDVAAIDLNLGCPAPVVYRKCAGGGLLRDLPRVESILGALRQAISIPFTVKTRIGFDSAADFDALLALGQRHGIDLLTVHGRTVLQMYQPGVRYDLIQHAARTMACPVLANGNVYGAAQALELLRGTGAKGLMIGRGAIRNPWLFQQIRQQRAGEKVTLPRGREVLAYIHALWEAEITPEAPEKAQVQRLKKFMNFIAEGSPEAGEFLFAIRRAVTRAEFFHICARFLDHDQEMELQPLNSHPLTADHCHGMPGEFGEKVMSPAE